MPRLPLYTSCDGSHLCRQYLAATDQYRNIYCKLCSLEESQEEHTSPQSSWLRDSGQCDEGWRESYPVSGVWWCGCCLLSNPTKLPGTADAHSREPLVCHGDCHTATRIVCSSEINVFKHTTYSYIQCDSVSLSLFWNFIIRILQFISCA